MAGVGEEKPVQRIVVAFEQLADVATSGGAAMEVGPFCDACAELSVFFRYIGSGFVNYANKDYVSKVNDLKEASKCISTLKDLIESDMKQKCVRKQGSHTRNLLRVKRVLDLVRVLCEEITISDHGNSLRAAALAAYDKVFAPHHGNGIRQAARIAMYQFPSISELLISLDGGDEGLAKVAMQSFVKSSGPVLQYVEELFNTRQLGIDW